MKFRSKVVEIDAALFDGNLVGIPNDAGQVKKGTCPDWFPALARASAGAIANVRSGEVVAVGKQLLIGTLEGTMTANAGDWIIRGTEGELYPCKPSVFERKYEPAE